MRSKFFEHYGLSDKKTKQIWKSGLVVFDTNILLNLYRYNKKTCTDILNYMGTLGDQLWIPYQVGWEYNNNRMEVAYKSQAACDTLRDRLDSDRTSLENFFKQHFHHHPYLQQKEFFKRYDRYNKYLKKYLNELKQNDNKYFDNDTILENLGKIYEGRVGDDCTDDELKTVYEEGKRRYAGKIPPGYKDNTDEKKAAGERHLYGDLIVWMQIIKKAKDSGKDVIFVSEDLKEDWMLEFRGKKYGPRRELIREFHEQTKNHYILIYNQEQFLEIAREKFNAELNEGTITEVKTINLSLLDNITNPVLPSASQLLYQIPTIDTYLKNIGSIDYSGAVKNGVFQLPDSYKAYVEDLQGRPYMIKVPADQLSQLTVVTSQLADKGEIKQLEYPFIWPKDSKTGY